ncbi:MAG: SAM-dependent methyltransferase [Zetaproteobacteria bacterium CG12_big_fil_rev_8_21_14_0_65_55_1124]|nr:MAG: SAM-dependent methyltransferase [Zetaproteobacteria bacterium CG1_02_55_237]PIS20008.1 MAG: SAM-dependent methyltransferase [Zetaproteobacteria bacterium CG08_land_8_20_14_0_20_55_17]PIW43571.1 MAG: SAM-dependent methyltransferase [Zetaproteobacteria bacterium CG12_big_fil_rev_8_21_14_0_65_55_1124]PIY52762.1 MAG: SAM-dependent methyltransferase [Zetaproteobacteria bacterium CG_4_10_14_0_8_um_filter_55_43]PIZ37946.1 MAG: SAM-dependent methyltransferase [Zetaproteobacteria bacterium CG_4_
MKKEQRKRIVDRHRDSLLRHGYHPNALYWSSREIQELRFEVLAGIGIKSGDALLDVGCGFGDFKRWFERQGGELKYTGIDLSPDLLAEAEKRHPDAEFLCGDLFDMDFAEQSFDWVILSGALNEQLGDKGKYARRVIKRMFALCRKGVAFNLLDARHLNAHDLQSHQPEEMLAWCRGLCPDATLHDAYLKNDFTIHMRR